MQGVLGLAALADRQRLLGEALGVVELARQDRFLVVNALELEQAKTKQLAGKLKDLGLENVLILIEAQDDKLDLASRNLPYVSVLPAKDVDPLSLARHHKVLATVGAVRMLEERLA